MIEFGEADIEGTWAYDNKYLLLVVAAGIALVGIALGWMVYERRRLKAIEPEVLEQGWYYDRTVSAFMGGPGRAFFNGLAWVDERVIDGTVNGIGRLVRGSANVLRRGQTGYVRNYAGVLGVGVVALLLWFVIGRGMI